MCKLSQKNIRLLKKIKKNNEKISWQKLSSKIPGNYTPIFLKNEWKKIITTKPKKKKSPLYITINNIINININFDPLLYEALSLFLDNNSIKKNTVTTRTVKTSTVGTSTYLDQLVDDSFLDDAFSENVLNIHIDFDNWYIHMNNGGVINKYSTDN